jgi:type IV pilus assembly protein PilN
VVRVNLLPERRASKARAQATEPGQLWILAVLGFVVLEVVAFLFVEKFMQDKLSDVKLANGKTDAAIKGIQGQMTDQAQVKAQLKDLRDREEAVQKLKAGRTGPTNVLLELSTVLTPGKEPTAPRERIEEQRAENPVTAMHPNWDTRRLWLTSYAELERAVKISGLAKEPEDVSELFRRLALSNYFQDVKLLPGNTVTDQASKEPLVRFEISAKVRY